MVKCKSCGATISADTDDTDDTGYSIRQIVYVVCTNCESKVVVPNKTISIPPSR